MLTDEQLTELYKAFKEAQRVNELYEAEYGPRETWWNKDWARKLTKGPQ